MQRFAVILFAFVAIFAIVVPSSVNALSHVKRDTNAGRFSRGLPPRAPSRRSTAKRHQNSQVSVPQTGRCQVRDSSGHSLGYLQNAPSGPGSINPGGNSDLSVQYNPKDSSITCVNPQFGEGGSFLGGSPGSPKLNAGSPSSVSLTNVENGKTDSFCTWAVDQSGKLIPEWNNSDGSTSPVSCAYNANKNTFVLTGDVDGFCSQNSGWAPVDLYLI